MATRPDQVIYMDDGDCIEVGDIILEVLHTPGHTPGGVSFYTPGYLFCGDLIFQGSIGRTDLRGGSLQGLMRAVREKVWDMPDDTRILPGHGPETTLGEERRHNPFLQGAGIVPFPPAVGGRACDPGRGRGHGRGQDISPQKKKM